MRNFSTRKFRQRLPDKDTSWGNFIIKSGLIPSLLGLLGVYITVTVGADAYLQSKIGSKDEIDQLRKHQAKSKAGNIGVWQGFYSWLFPTEK